MNLVIIKENEAWIILDLSNEKTILKTDSQLKAKKALKALEK